MKKNTAIYHIRNKLGLKQRQIGRFLEVSQNNLSQIEDGKGRNLTDKMLRLAEIHLKANPDYLRYQIGAMFTADHPLYSDRIKIVCNALNTSPESVIESMKDEMKQQRMKAVMLNDEPPDYDLLKAAFRTFDGVNYDYLIDATGSPVIKPGSDEKQFYKTFEDVEYTQILREALAAYRQLVAEKQSIIEEQKKTIDLLNQKINEHERE